MKKGFVLAFSILFAVGAAVFPASAAESGVWLTVTPEPAEIGRGSDVREITYTFMLHNPGGVSIHRLYFEVKPSDDNDLGVRVSFSEENPRRDDNTAEKFRSFTTVWDQSCIIQARGAKKDADLTGDVPLVTLTVEVDPQKLTGDILPLEILGGIYNNDENLPFTVTPVRLLDMIAGRQELHLTPPQKGKPLDKSPEKYSEQYDIGELRWFMGTEAVEPGAVALPGTAYTAEVSLTASAGRAFDQTGALSFLLNGDTVIPEGEFVVEKKTVTIRHTFPATEKKALTGLKITEPAFELAVPKNDEACPAVFPLAASGTYDDGATETVTPQWSLVGTAPAGVTLEEGALRVDRSATDDARVTVKAVLEGREVLREFTVCREAPNAARILLKRGERDVTGQTETVIIPTRGEKKAAFTAEVYDQYGVRMKAVPDWMWEGTTVLPLAGGTVTVPAGAEAGCYALTARCGAAKASLTLRTECKKPVTFRNFSEKSFVYGAVHPMETALPSAEGEIAYRYETADGKRLPGAPTAAGVYRVTVFCESETHYGALSVTLTILPKEIAESEVTVAGESLTENGAAQTPAVTVRDGEQLLTENIDYRLTYENNVSAGTATAQVVGMGNYQGTVRKPFLIGKRSFPSGEMAADGEASFWQTLRERMEGAKQDEVIEFDVGDREELPGEILKALREHPGVTLSLLRADGSSIRLSAGVAARLEERSYLFSELWECCREKTPAPGLPLSHEEPAPLPPDVPQTPEPEEESTPTEPEESGSLLPWRLGVPAAVIVLLLLLHLRRKKRLSA